MAASALSIKELKRILAEAGVGVPSGIEKQELVAMAQKVLDTPKVHFPVCKQQGCPVERCKAIFLFFHGFGADEHQFDFFLGHHPEIALITPKSESEGWWPLNVMEWAMALQQPDGLLRKVQETPRGLVEARAKAVAFVQQLLGRAPPGTRLLIGGFSQGGVMATDLALSLPAELGTIYLAAFSAFPVSLGYWQERAHVANIQSLVTHGRADNVVPFAASSLMVQVLKTRGDDKVEFCPHAGAHTLGDSHVMQRCKAFFDQVLK